MKKPMIMMLIVVSILFGMIAGWYFFKQYKIKQFMTAMQHATITVSTVTATPETWTPFIADTGSLQAVNGVKVSPQVAGTISEVFFNSGEVIKKGQALVQMDDRLEQANLKDYQARLIFAQQTYHRDTQLIKDGAISKSQADSDLAALHEAEAIVESTQVSIDYKRITAPFDGKIGINQVNVGQYIQPGDTIASLQALHPLYVLFSLPERYIDQLAVSQEVDIIADPFPNHVYKGKINGLDSQVSAETRGITVEAILPNEEMKLLPGMFVTIKVILPAQQNVITLPQTAINNTLYGDSVYLVVDDNGTLKTKLRYVTTGERRDSVIAILKGVNAGDQVVSSGQLKLSDDQAVTINNSVEP